VKRKPVAMNSNQSLFIQDLATSNSEDTSRKVCLFFFFFPFVVLIKILSNKYKLHYISFKNKNKNLHNKNNRKATWAIYLGKIKVNP
jgi:hypothetical protein